MRFLHWCGRHPISTLLLTAIGVSIAYAVHWWYWPSIPTASAGKIEAIEVHLPKWPKEPEPDCGQEEQRITVTDPEQIRPFLEVFQTAQRASNHKCGESGTITIRMKNGESETLRILPGHDPAYYEYRYGSRINRVDRQSFITALRLMGITEIKQLPPS